MEACHDRHRADRSGSRPDARPRPRTPLLNAPLLDRVAGRRVFVKAECLQLTGSFKARGGWSAVSALDPQARAAGRDRLFLRQPRAGRGSCGRPPWRTLRHPDALGRAAGEDRQHPRLWGRGGALRPRDRGPRRHRRTAGGRPGPDPDPALRRPAGHRRAGDRRAWKSPNRRPRPGSTEAEVLVCCGGGGLASGIALGA